MLGTAFAGVSGGHKSGPALWSPALRRLQIAFRIAGYEILGWDDGLPYTGVSAFFCAIVIGYGDWNMPVWEGSMSEPKLIHSALSRTIREDFNEVRIDIYRLETTDWSLEVVDETGASTVWDVLFPTDQAALDEALKTIREEGIRTFLSGETPVIH